MAKTLVLAEKPSVARELARVLGCKQSGEGYLEGEKYIVTWALGHLVELAPPEDYDKAWAKWDMLTLPMLPERMKTVVIPQSGRQFRAVQAQLRRGDVGELVIATDAGREGELVARWILEKAGWKGPARRLWISSQTDKAIREGFTHLRPAAEYDNLFRSARARSEADWLHMDIMDGVFVPNISFGFPVLEALKPICKKPMDVHLMIVEPQKFIPEVAATGAYMMNVHYEACTHLHRTVAAIKEAGMKAAVTLNPHTPISLLEDILQDLDMVLLMSVNPGYGGQKFIEHSIDKTARLKDMILAKGLNTLIEVDGGVNMQTAKPLLEVGADVLVAGSFVFRSPDPLKTIRELKEL